jgi:ankyrin repeat protein
MSATVLYGMTSPADQLLQSFLAGDHATVARLLRDNPHLRWHLNDCVPLPDGHMPPLAAASSREMMDVLIDNGARVEEVSRRWAPGFGTENIAPDVARYLVERGAELTIHAAVGIGLTDVVRDMLLRDASLVHARGGDGCLPLHFCREIELARLLLSSGADVEARDEDHDSTAAQWRIGDAPHVVRLLLEHGARADIFLAAGLGDLEMARLLVAEDAACPTYRIGNNEGPFPGIGFEGRGGTIYQWTLGFNLSPHEVAARRGHTEVYEFLLDHSPARTRFLVACTMANRPLALQIAAEHPDLVGELDEEDLALLPKFCWETNKSIEAVRLMLDVGFPVAAREFNHGFMALHNAAWCGDVDLVRLLIERGHPTDVRDPVYNSTAIGWAVHSCLEAKRHPAGQFADVVELLLANGTPFEPQRFPVGHDAIDAVLKHHLDALATRSQTGGRPEGVSIQ